MIWRNIVDMVAVRVTDRLFADGVRLLATDSSGNAADPDWFMDRMATRALEIALTQIGRGEEGGNNMGPDVARYIRPAKPPQNWCAGLVGWCYQEAFAAENFPLPFARSLGAKRLGENVAKVGRKFTDPTQVKPGDLMVFHRGTQGSWQGHVAIVDRVLVGSDNRVATIEGNCGPKVMRMTRQVHRDRFAFFASVRRG